MIKKTGDSEKYFIGTHMSEANECRFPDSAPCGAVVSARGADPEPNNMLRSDQWSLRGSDTRGVSVQASRGGAERRGDE